MATFRKRNLFLMLILMGGLQGLYLLYWIASVQNEIKRCSETKLGGFLTVVSIIVTFGIYYFVWQWKTCKFLRSCGAADNSVATLVLSFLFIGIIVNPLIIQKAVNTVAFARLF